MRIVSVILLLLGALFVYVPFHIEFTGYVLILLGAGIGLCCILHKRKKAGKFMHFLIWAMSICAGLLAAAMIGIEIYGARPNPAPQGEYAVVLGAQINGTQPSRILRHRLDTALAYLEANPGRVVIVSGGQGSDESVTEASVMLAYLLTHGADENRILLEEKASNTRENLLYSADVAKENGLASDRVTVITSEFHQCRAAYIAHTLGLQSDFLSARTEDVFMRVNYDLREVFSFVKAFVVAGKE